MAHKKAGGSTRNGRDSESKRLGVKRFGGESVLAHLDVKAKATKAASKKASTPEETKAKNEPKKPKTTSTKTKKKD